MATIDLSKWMGEPPANSSSKKSPTGSESESEYGSAREGDGGRDVGSDGASEDDASDHALESEGNALAQHQKRSTSDDQQPTSPSDRLQQVSVEIPPLAADSSWERLPGYYTAVKVLREVESERFLLRLGSGELEVVRFTLLITSLA